MLLISVWFAVLYQGVTAMRCAVFGALYFAAHESTGIQACAEMAAPMRHARPDSVFQINRDLHGLELCRSPRAATRC